MKTIVLFCLLVLVASCEKNSHYNCHCEIHTKLLHYSPYSEFYKSEIITDVKGAEADSRCDVFIDQYKLNTKNSFDSLKLVDSGTVMGCGLDEIDYGQK